MFDRLLKRFAGTPAEVARKIQMTGLVESARWLSKLLGEPPPDPVEMPDWIKEIFRSVVERMCRYDDEALPSPEECGAVERAREFMAGMPRETRREFQSLLVLIELSPWVLGPRRGRFSRLQGPYRDGTLQKWEQSDLAPQRAGFNAIKSVVMMGYWSRPESWPAIGYSVADNPGVSEPQKGEWVEREGGA